ncbi:reverse transcriptase domain-containing protein [Trichonephila clavipes]|nr:reverse transcriptase domain-containing protein [Trichonephila clavipes]
MGRMLCLAHFLKKGDQLECRNYRGITLLNTAYKIFSNLLFARLQPYTDKVIGNYQSGFRPQRSTIDQIHMLRQILEKTKEDSIKTFHLFVGFKAAYDSINRDEMIEAMTEFKIPKKLVNLTKATLKNVRCRIKIQKYLSEPITTERGLRQGDSLACLLFNLVLEKCIRDKRGWAAAAPCGIGHYNYWLTHKIWTLNLETVRALETFERKALRTIFGHVKDRGCWRTGYNSELYRLYKEPQVTQVIRSNRLRWFGHIWRSPKNNRPELTLLRIIWDLEQEEDHQQGG